mgnify:CR=1 FL=1
MNFDKQPSISDLTTSLVTIAENFEFLSSLKENENLQKTTTSRVLGRAVFGYKQNPIQKTLDLGIGIYAKFSDAYGKESFDYIEEPLQNPRELSCFPYPFALDETLREPENRDLVYLPMCAALILKPTLLGDISLFLKMHRRCILSHCFEGPIGVGQIAKLAKRYNLLHELHGLDTLSN